MSNLHWAFIMDGNGRWAKLRGLPRKKGHERGVQTVNTVVDFCLKQKNIGIISLYVFSTENWNRSPMEVNGLFSLAKQYASCIDEFVKKGIKVLFSSSYDNLPNDLVEKMIECQLKTQNCTNLVVNLCFNYGGRAEILNAAKKLAKQNKLADATEDDFLKAMYNDLPSPDLLLRTGGQIRLSNFMLYQSAYTELLFTDILGPDLTEEDLQGFLDAFNKRVRNFGKVK